MSDDQNEALSFCKKLLNWRKSKSVIHTGKLKHFIPKDGVYVFFRYNETEKVMVIINKNADAINLDLERFSEMLGDSKLGKDVLTGDSVQLDKEASLKPMHTYILELE